MIAYVEGAKRPFAPTMHSFGKSLKLIKHVHTSVQASRWPLLTYVVTRVNMRNVYCYKLSEYAQSLQ